MRNSVLKRESGWGGVERKRGGGGRGRALWRDQGRGGLWWGGLRLEGEGKAAAILSPSNGGGGLVVCAAAALAPLPHNSRELEQCWQICLHVFIIIKNVTDPSSLEAQQIPLITFLSLSSLCRAFAFSHSFYPIPPPRSVWLVGGGPFLFLLWAWWLPGGF